jgi:hypothetical protein
LPLFYTYNGQSNFEYDYPVELETEFENILEYQSGDHIVNVQLINKKSEVKNLVLLSLSICRTIGTDEESICVAEQEGEA